MPLTLTERRLGEDCVGVDREYLAMVEGDSLVRGIWIEKGIEIGGRCAKCADKEDPGLRTRFRGRVAMEVSTVVGASAVSVLGESALIVRGLTGVGGGFFVTTDDALLLPLLVVCLLAIFFLLGFLLRSVLETDSLEECQLKSDSNAGSARESSCCDDSVLNTVIFPVGATESERVSGS